VPSDQPRGTRVGRRLEQAAAPHPRPDVVAAAQFETAGPASALSPEAAGERGSAHRSCPLLPTAYCLLPTAYCLLPIAYCLLPIAYCPLPNLSTVPAPVLFSPSFRSMRGAFRRRSTWDRDDGPVVTAATRSTLWEATALPRRENVSRRRSDTLRIARQTRLLQEARENPSAGWLWCHLKERMRQDRRGPRLPRFPSSEGKNNKRAK
jgi:hypothetical protein